MGPARAPGDAQNGPPGVHIPIRRPQAGEGRDHHHAAGVLHGLRETVTLRGGVDQVQLVPQPLNGAAAVENAALQGVIRLAVYLPRYRSHQPCPAAHRLRTHVHQGKAACAVGIFGLSGGEAALAEQGRLLVSRCAAHRYARHLFKARDTGLYIAIGLAVGNGPGQDGHRDAQQSAQLLVPLQLMYVKEHGPGGVGKVRYMLTRQLPDEIRLHRAEQDLSPQCPFPDAGHMIQYPADLGGGEIGVQQQAGGGLNPLRKALLFQLLAQLCRPAALPDDGVIHRLAGIFVPQHRRLPLVGNADAYHLARPHRTQGVCRRPALRAPNVPRVVLHPAGLGIDLGEVILPHRGDLPPAVKQNGAGAGGSLVQG